MPDDNELEQQQTEAVTTEERDVSAVTPEETSDFLRQVEGAMPLDTVIQPERDDAAARRAAEQEQIYGVQPATEAVTEPSSAPVTPSEPQDVSRAGELVTPLDPETGAPQFAPGQFGFMEVRKADGGTQRITYSEWVDLTRLSRQNPEEYIKTLTVKGVLPEGSIPVQSESGTWGWISGADVERRKSQELERATWEKEVLSTLPPELQQAYESGGVEAFNKAVADIQDKTRQGILAWETEILPYLPSELQSEYYKGGQSALAQAIDKYNEDNRNALALYHTATLSMQKQQADALKVLKDGGYAESGIYEEGFGQPRYRVDKFIKDNPTYESVLVLSSAGFDEDVIKAARDYVQAAYLTSQELDYYLDLDTIKQLGGVKDISLGALGRALSDLNIPIVGGHAITTWRSLGQEDKAAVAAIYNEDTNKEWDSSIAATIRQITDETISAVPYTGAVGTSIKTAIEAAGVLGEAPFAAVGVVKDHLNKWHSGDVELRHIPVDGALENSITPEEYVNLSLADKPKYRFDPVPLTKNDDGDYIVTGWTPIYPLLSGMVESVTGAGSNLIDRAKGFNTDSLLYKDLAILGVTVAPIVMPVAFKTVKGIYTRAKPGSLSHTAVALTQDVGRSQIPEGMTRLTARQLLEDVETAQLTGRVLRNRANSYTETLGKIPDGAFEYLEINKKPNGTTDIIFKSADGNIVGHVSGFQRVANDTIFHATGDVDTLLRELQDKGYLEVSATAGEKPVMFFSQQMAENFLYNNPGDNPGVIALKISRDNWKELPKEVLDSPTTGAMRDKLHSLARSGRLEDGIYPVYKTYGRNTGMIEYEVVGTPNLKMYPLKDAWYAPLDRGAPKTTFDASIGFTGRLELADGTIKTGKPVNIGDTVPIYWLGTKDAIAAGAKLPTIMQFYKANLLGDLTAARKWLPHNIRIRPRESEISDTGVYSTNPLYSKFQQISFKARPEDATAGRVSGIIHNTDGRILLTRTQGANHFDLPGGGTLAGEPIKNAIIREIFEETGLKPKIAEHIDTLNSKFTTTGKTKKFQIFDIEADGKLLPGREIAEYVWWDGKSALNYPVSPFTREAINRAMHKDVILTEQAVDSVLRDIVDDAKKTARNEAELKAKIQEKVTELRQDIRQDIVPLRTNASLKRFTPGMVSEYQGNDLERLQDNEALVYSGYIDDLDYYKVEIPDETRLEYIPEDDRNELEAYPQAYTNAEAVMATRIPVKGEIMEPLTASEPEAIMGERPELRAEPRLTTEAVISTEPMIATEPVTVPRPRITTEPILSTEPSLTVPFTPQPEPLIEPVPEIVPPPPPPPPPKLKKTPKRTTGDSVQAVTGGAIAWRQGFVWYVVNYPYKSKGDIEILKSPPPGARIVTGIDSAYKTIQRLTGVAPSYLTIDMGIMDINIRRANGKLSIRYNKDKKQRTVSDISIKGIKAK